MFSKHPPNNLIAPSYFLNCPSSANVAQEVFKVEIKQNPNFFQSLVGWNKQMNTNYRELWCIDDTFIYNSIWYVSIGNELQLGGFI